MVQSTDLSSRQESNVKLWRTPLDIDKFSSPHGEVHIIPARCKGCNLCVRYCPRDVLEISDEMNEKGYHPPRAIHPEQCVVCRLCELICPEFCIYTVEVEEGEDG
jgi:2-oxoglutarate ferredoxin oxidoreductase subunit delta